MFSRGVYAYVSWFRGSHFFASLLARFLSRFTAFKGYGNPYYGVAIPPRLRSLWALIEFFSFLPYYVFRRLLSMFKPVIGDRGVLDFIVWIVVTLDHTRFLASVLGRFLARLLSVSTAIYVTADLAVLRRRALGVPRSFLMREAACYDVLAKYYASHVIDTTSKAPKEALEELVKFLGMS
ncbi:MAG: thymidylate kinase [Candidatus Nezhaarchaeota archaeon]|nr:thymidylate kinase [Candidatus Nezhaarchaeota archaeon]